jgi:hypothetical protein
VVNNGQPVSANIVNAAFASRTVDTSLAGVVDLNNVTESTDLVTGGVRTLGGVAITKNLNVGGAIGAPTGNIVDVNATTVDVTTLNATDANVSDDLVVLGDTTVQLLDAVNVNADDLLVNNDGTVTGDLGVNGELTVGGDSNLAVVNATDMNPTGNVVIGGNLTVNGTTTTVNSATLEVTDANVLVNNGGNDTTAQGAGLTVERATTNGALKYDSALASKWKIGNVGSEKEVITAGDAQELTLKSLVQPQVFEEGSVPSTPASGYWKIYPKSDGFYQLDDVGNESKIGSGSSSLLNVVFKSANYTLVSGNDVVIVDTASTQTLPTAVGLTGKVFTIINKSSSPANVVVATTSAQTIGGRASADIVLAYFNDYITVVSDGSNWEILSRVENAFASSTTFSTINGASGSYQASSATLALGVGTWDIETYFGVYSGVGGVSVSVNDMSGIFAADGANTVTAPTALSSSIVCGVTSLNTGYSLVNTTDASEVSTLFRTRLIITSGVQNVYAVPVITYATAGTGNQWYSKLFARRV